MAVKNGAKNFMSYPNVYIYQACIHKTNFQRTRDFAGLKISPTAVKSASLYQLSMSSFTVRNVHLHRDANIHT